MTGAKAGMVPVFRPPKHEERRRMDQCLSRAYRPDDFDACLSIFDGNVPAFFSPDERAEFVQFLQDIEPERAPYIVVTLGGSIVACGGLSLDVSNAVASLSWGMVDRAFHRQGLGTRLTQERLRLARASATISRLVLATSQHTAGFYQQHGFTVSKITPDGFGAGLDRYDMTLPMTCISNNTTENSVSAVASG
jgi:ribosomal protein S18 acetylase RimI-like enzyme